MADEPRRHLLGDMMACLATLDDEGFGRLVVDLNNARDIAHQLAPLVAAGVAKLRGDFVWIDDGQHKQTLRLIEMPSPSTPNA